MNTPTRVLIRPMSAFWLLQPAFLFRLVRFRWRMVLAMVVISSGVALWAAVRTHSARAVIYVEGLGLGGVLTNVDCAGMPEAYWLRVQVPPRAP